MAVELREWQEITPEELRPAVGHIDEMFDEAEWNCSEITGKLCYSTLHPGAVDRAKLAPYEEAFITYRRILGPDAARQFDSTIRIGTPPAIFKAYLDAFGDGLQAEVRRLFSKTLQIGFANSGKLGTHPVEWTKALFKILIGRQSPRVANWIKSVCDKQDAPKPDLTHDDFEELVFWRTWRAPRLVYMQPSGNAEYNPADVWIREDETKTQQLLKALTDRFIQSVEIDLDKTAGAAHVACAQNGQPQGSNAPVKAVETQGEHNGAPLYQLENLRQAIRKRKARVAEMERILHQPLPAIQRYGGIFVPKISRRGGQELQEEKLGHLEAIAELEREAERLSASPAVAPGKPESRKGGTITPLRSKRTGRKPDPNVASRRSIVRANQALSAEQLCKRLDLDGIHPPEEWEDFPGWEKAYGSRHWAKKIRRLLSMDKRRP